MLTAEDRQSKLAVMEIDDQSGKLDKRMLEAAAEALRTEIGATNKFVLISKERQRAVIKEQKKESWKECYDQSCRIQLGQALAADTVLQSSVNLFGGTYTLTSELIDLAKEATIKTAKADFDGSEKGLADAIKSIAAQLAGKKPGGSSFQTGKIGEQVEAWEIGQGEETIVKFDSVPVGAVVMVDGKLLCQTTPCSKMLTQGKHEITIQKENYLPKSKVFDIVKGRPPLVAELQPDFGWIEVSSVPSGIEVLLDGKSIGKTPITKRELSPGPHQVVASHDCFYQTGEKFILKQREIKSVRLELAPKDSGIKVTAQDKEGNDLEAEVFVDGKNIGAAPGTYKVPLCSKELVVKSKAGQYKQMLDLEEKKVAAISAVLKKSEGYEISDDVVIDNKTGLMWQRKRANNGMKHTDAISYCEDLTLGGYSDWRLPSISELKTLIVGCQSGADDCMVKNSCSSGSCWSKSCYCEQYRGPGEDGYYWKKGVWQGGGNWFWSSSVQSDNTQNAWYTDVDDGKIYAAPTDTTSAGIRCVRNNEE